jgi:L-fuculose-phosphate aldolase
MRAKDSNLDLELRAVGWVRSTITDRQASPKSASLDMDSVQIVFEPAFEEALHDVAPGQEVVVLTWLHQGDRSVLKCHPRGDTERPMRGIFSTRSPDRPNPIGLHRVRVLGLEGLTLTVHPLEAIDGTPVVDVKPVDRHAPETPWGPFISSGEGDRLARAGRDAWSKGLLNGFNGNLSLKQDQRVILTCSGSAKGHLGPGDLVCVDLDSGEPLGPGRVSSESAVHLAIYRQQPQAGAVVHTHPVHLLAMSLQNRDWLRSLPLFEAGLFADDLALVPAMTPGTLELGRSAGQAARQARAILLQNHGLVCWAETLTQALGLTEELEGLARIGLLAGDGAGW